MAGRIFIGKVGILSQCPQFGIPLMPGLCNDGRPVGIFGHEQEEAHGGTKLQRSVSTRGRQRNAMRATA